MPIAPNLIFDVQATILGSSSSGGAGVKNVYNVFTFLRQSSVPAFTKASFNTAFQLNVLVPLAAAMNVRWSANLVAVRVLNDYLDAEQTFAAAHVGAIATDSLPLNSAVYLLLRTALRGRNYRGAKHFSPASEVDTTQDVLTGAGLARWQAVRDAVGASWVDGNGNTWVPTVYSRNLSSPNLLPVATIVSNAVTQSLLDLNIGDMKKRRSRTIR
jgi:hypothetical protein